MQHTNTQSDRIGSRTQGFIRQVLKDATPVQSVYSLDDRATKALLALEEGEGSFARQLVSLTTCLMLTDAQESKQKVLIYTSHFSNWILGSKLTHSAPVVSNYV